MQELDDTALFNTPVPEDAIAAYRKYRGRRESAWEVGDDNAYDLITRWEAAIWAQRLV